MDAETDALRLRIGPLAVRYDPELALELFVLFNFIAHYTAK